MGLLSAVLSLPVSIILVRTMMKRKTGEPFSKGDVTGLLLWGALSAVLAMAVTGVITAWKAIRFFGPELVKEAFKNPQGDALQKIWEIIQNTPEEEFSYLSIFLNTLLSVGIVEELSRYLILRASTKNKACCVSWLDMVLCGGIVGVGFQILEDLFYSSGGIATAVMRAITPFHFTFGVIMGYYIGKAKVTGKILYHLPALLIPVLLHTLFDSSIHAMEQVEDFFLLVLFSIILLLVLTFVMLKKIRKWSGSGELDVPLNGEAPRQAA